MRSVFVIAFFVGICFENIETVNLKKIIKI